MSDKPKEFYPEGTRKHRHRYDQCCAGNESIGGYLTPDDIYYCKCGKVKP